MGSWTKGHQFIATCTTMFKSTVTFIVILCVVSIGANRFWEKSDLMKWNEKTKNLPNFSQDCDDSLGDCPNEISHMEFKRKQNPKTLVLSDLPREDPMFKYLPTSQPEENQCSCGRENRFVDLGPNTYPRYIADMVCNAGGCGIYSCRPKTYKLWVMKRRTSGASAFSDLDPIPMELRANWSGLGVLVTVDCECGL
ncbi:PREDICTED: protein trunk-like [Nicrophorus vespilloides]|uniref:Protein trunk-like n=1 Tax=Nicrophorus vespilloides TaxID=110193 RepID=A0ABM1MN82_NICVS|nr:PREDICTED: protein trunk-like [Nicrophorus vespilloides]